MRKKLSEKRCEIEKLFGENKDCYAKAYALMAAAGSLKEKACVIYSDIFNKQALKQIATDLVKGDNSRFFMARELFTCAYTPNGLVDYTSQTINSNNAIMLKNNCGRPLFMNMVLAAAKNKGANCEIFMDPLLPHQALHLALPDITFISADEGADIDTDDFADRKKLADHKGFLEYAQNKAEELIKNSVEYIAQSKRVHDEIENIYTSNMDFSSESVFKKDFLEEII